MLLATKPTITFVESPIMLGVADGRNAADGLRGFIFAGHYENYEI